MLDPKLPPSLRVSHVLAAPLATHWREATCREVECKGYREGWRTTVTADSPQALYIRTHSGRRFRESVPAAGMVAFDFPPGQTCFAASKTPHKIRLDREELFGRRGGDHRGNPTGERTRFATPEDWRDDLGEHLDNLRDAIERG